MFYPRAIKHGNVKVKRAYMISFNNQNYIHAFPKSI
jgi:hypothetical protein